MYYQYIGRGYNLKKVAIITIQSINFGNRLQNYALQETIKSLGYDVYTIRRERRQFNFKVLLEILKDWARIVLGTRKGLYLRFNHDRIQFGKQYALANEVEQGLGAEYDLFVTGSDQVWNPHYGYLVGTSDLLCFAEKCQKVSYAASFGVDSIPLEKKRYYEKALEDFKAISVREKTGAEIIRDLTGIDATVTLDPTLLLKKSQYQEIEKQPSHVPQGKYILIYLLGGKSDLFIKYIRTNPNMNGIEYFDILQSDASGRDIAMGPSEFIYMIDHSEMVLTDSFHATVFATIFHKPVRTFPREGIDMSTRIITLASTLGLESNFTADGEFFIDYNVNYELIERYLNEEREKSIAFLKNALNE